MCLSTVYTIFAVLSYHNIVVSYHIHVMIYSVRSTSKYIVCQKKIDVQQYVHTLPSKTKVSYDIFRCLSTLCMFIPAVIVILVDDERQRKRERIRFVRGQR